MGVGAVLRLRILYKAKRKGTRGNRVNKTHGISPINTWREVPANLLENCISKPFLCTFKGKEWSFLFVYLSWHITMKIRYWITLTMAIQVCVGSNCASDDVRGFCCFALFLQFVLVSSVPGINKTSKVNVMNNKNRELWGFLEFCPNSICSSAKLPDIVHHSSGKSKPLVTQQHPAIHGILMDTTVHISQGLRLAVPSIAHVSEIHGDLEAFTQALNWWAKSTNTFHTSFINSPHGLTES